MYKVLFIFCLEGRKYISRRIDSTGSNPELALNVFHHTLRHQMKRNTHRTGLLTSATTDTASCHVHHAVNLPLHICQRSRPGLYPLRTIDLHNTPAAITQRTGSPASIASDAFRHFLHPIFPPLFTTHLFQTINQLEIFLTNSQGKICQICFYFIESFKLDNFSMSVNGQHQKIIFFQLVFECK